MKKAFSLFELLVSISIMAILVAVATTSYSVAQKKARDSRRIEDINAIQKAAEVYYSQNAYVYPSGSSQFLNASLGAVLQKWPVDPKGVGWTAYSYSPNGTFSTYCACAAMENVASGNSPDATCVSAFGSSGAYFCTKNQQ